MSPAIPTPVENIIGQFLTFEVAYSDIRMYLHAVNLGENFK